MIVDISVNQQLGKKSVLTGVTIAKKSPQLLESCCAGSYYIHKNYVIIMVNYS